MHISRGCLKIFLCVPLSLRKLFALPSDLCFMCRSAEQKEERKDDTQQRELREVIYLILIHTFYSIITIIMMMIEIHKQQWHGRANLCVAYERDVFRWMAGRSVKGRRSVRFYISAYFMHCWSN